MTPDLVDQMFANDGDDREEEFYPGSKRKIEREKPNVEFIPDPWRENYTIKKIRGVDMKMYPIGALASALGVSVQSVRSWTAKGYLPMAPYRLPSTMVIAGEKAPGRRLYTEALIEAAVEAFEKHGVLGARRIEWKNYSALSIEIQEAWTRITATNK